MSNVSVKRKFFKSYTPEFRIQAIKLVLSKEKSLSKTARDLGIPEATLHTWVKKSKAGEWPVPEENISAAKLNYSDVRTKSPNVSQKLHEQLIAEQRKSIELEKQVKRLTQEREILKKAIAYCLDVPK
ncbi:MAG: transposase [Oligoflexales bacterium]|nr:transposase [Oligoflexales bacterium]